MKSTDKIPLREAFLELNNTCNFNCIFCTYPKMKRSKSIMSKTQAFDLLNQIKNDFEVDHLSLHLYGEPMLHPDIAEITAHAEKNRININLTTNGALLTSEKLTAFLDQNIWRIVLSVQHTPDKFFSRGPTIKMTSDEYYSHIVELVKIFSANKIKNPSCRTVLEIHYLTTDDIKPNISLAKNESDIDQIINYWKNKLNGPASNFSTSKIYDDETGFRISISKECYLRFKPAISFGNAVGVNDEKECETGYCFFPSSTLVILSNGDLVPCCLDYDGEMVFGNVFADGGIRKVWENKSAKKLRDDFENKVVTEKRCRQCLGGSHFGSPI